MTAALAAAKGRWKPSSKEATSLVASGRIPDSMGLGLEAARIRTAPRASSSTSICAAAIGKVYAIGHSASPILRRSQASIAFRNAVLRLPARLDRTRVPRLVDSGRNWHRSASRKSRREPGSRRSAFFERRSPTMTGPMPKAPRTATSRRLRRPAGRILGCSIVGHRAHDLIVPWGLAMAKGLRASDLAEVVPRGAVYSEVIGEASLESVKMSAQSPWLRRALGFIRRWG